MPQMNSQEMQLWHAWQLMSNRRTTRMRCNDFENTSNTSEFVFNADEKYTQKKLSKLNMDKLKTICEKMNLSTEGNKNQLITRILE